MENGTIEQLVTSAKQGDNQAFRELYDYSYEVVQKECLKNLHNSIDAEDAIQETYLSIFRRLDSLKDPQKFLGWARTIAHNTCVDYIVHQKRKVGKDDFKPPVSDDRFEGMDKIDLEDEELSPEDKAEQDMIHSLLQTALDDIPIQRATCLALYQQGISYREISEQLSIPMGTVKSNVYYAKKALKKKIEKIERDQKVQIHGFTLLLVNGQVQVQWPVPTSHSFITTKIKPSASERDKLWKQISRKSPQIHPKLALWKKILPALLALIVIVTGIILSINYAGHHDLQDSGSHPKPQESQDAEQRQQQNGPQRDSLSNNPAEPKNNQPVSAKAENSSSDSPQERVYLTQSSPDAFAAEQFLSRIVKEVLEDAVKKTNPDVADIQFLEEDWSWDGTTLNIGMNVRPVLKTQSSIEDYKESESNTTIVSDYIFFNFYNIFKDPKTGIFTPETIRMPRKIIVQSDIQDGQKQVVKLKTEY